MKKSLLIVAIIVLILSSCKRNSVKDRICGVWVFQNSVSKVHKNDTSGFFGSQFPIVFDFKNNGDLVIKNFAHKIDTVLNWELKSDSILTFDSINHIIHSISTDSITLLNYDKIDSLWITYKRPKKIDLNHTKTEVKDILLANIWSIEDSINRKFPTHFEYFDNKTVVFRYKSLNRNFNDSIDNLQVETWGLEEYKGYYFLYNYIDMMLGNGNYSRINQIIDISPTSYTISDSYSETDDRKFVSKKYRKKNKNSHQLIKGRWVSKNSRDKTYGRNIPNRSIKIGIIALFEGDLFLTIDDKELRIQLDTLDSKEYTYQISKDLRSLILEYHINTPRIQGIHVECADILELTNEKLKLRLFDTYFYTGHEKPNTYLLNYIQEFERCK